LRFKVASLSIIRNFEKLLRLKFTVTVPAP